jgi:4-hydroxy-tetrahydrodipicolinate synthase
VPGERTLQGVFVPLITPFDEAGRVDVECLERLAADFLDAGAAGIVALGTTGEASALDDAERSQVVAACARVCGDRGAQLIVGAGTNDTRTTIARHEQLAEVPGVVASLAVVPYYVRPSEAGSSPTSLRSPNGHRSRWSSTTSRTAPGGGWGPPRCWSSRPTRPSPA